MNIGLIALKNPFPLLYSKQSFNSCSYSTVSTHVEHDFMLLSETCIPGNRLKRLSIQSQLSLEAKCELLHAQQALHWTDPTTLVAALEQCCNEISKSNFKTIVCSLKKSAVLVRCAPYSWTQEFLNAGGLECLTKLSEYLIKVNTKNKLHWELHHRLIVIVNVLLSERYIWHMLFNIDCKLLPNLFQVAIVNPRGWTVPFSVDLLQHGFSHETPTFLVPLESIKDTLDLLIVCLSITDDKATSFMLEILGFCQKEENVEPASPTLTEGWLKEFEAVVWELSRDSSGLTSRARILFYKLSGCNATRVFGPRMFPETTEKLIQCLVIKPLLMFERVQLYSVSHYQQLSHCQLLDLLVSSHTSAKPLLMKKGLARILLKLKSLSLVSVQQWNERFSHWLPSTKTVD